MKRIYSIILCLLILSWCAVAPAQMICPLDNSAIKPKEVKSLKAFARIAILEEGRVKPLDTYARNVLLQFSGRRSFEKKPAIQWLARLLFAPETTRNDRIFLINNPEIAQALSVESEKERRYSFDQLEKNYPKLVELAQAAGKIEEKERGVVDAEILRVHKNLELYAKLSQNFLFAFPHQDFTIDSPQLKTALEIPSPIEQLSFIDIALRADKIYQLSAGLEHKNPDQWSEEDKTVTLLMSNLYHWSFAYRDLPLTIVPSYSGDESWLSPWDAFDQGFKTDEGREELSQLRNLMVAYWNGRQLEFDLAARAFSDLIKKRVAPRTSGRDTISVELLYNKLNLFLFAKLCYGFAFLLFLFSLMSERRILYKSALALILLGFVLQVLAMAMRIKILARPPVSTLYETFVFVSVIAVLLGLIIERFNKQWLGIVVSSVCGFVFLLIAGKFSADGDTLKVLVAVLNSNFWLSTHVLSITTGYAGSCVAGIVGHVYILQAITRPKDKKLLDSTARNLMGILGFGLAMTFLGTNLGGIWADQSWGRFWGWDPKENGALLIVIWTAIIFHARIARMIGPLGVAVASVFLIVVVMWAWFGVNLLSVGLHSYGFTSGLAFNLTVYAVIQLLFLLIAVPLAVRKLGTDPIFRRDKVEK